MSLTLSKPALPVLDLDDLTADRADFLRRLRATARDIGFFYLAGHGIDRDEMDTVLAISRRFFALPEAEKRKVQMIHSPHFRGYNQAGLELTRGREDWREQFDIHSEREALPRTPDAPAWTRLQGPNLWPEALPELRPVLLRWQARLTEVATRVVSALVESLEQPAEALAAIYADRPNQTMKLIRYPGVEGARSDQGVGAHKDSGLLTLLLQDEHRGLQVQAEDGCWIEADPIPGTFVVNIGELLELASNGYLRATIHRVVSPAPGTERLSVAFFLGARLDATVPLLQLPPALAAEAKGPASDPENPLFREVGQNYLKGRLRSHPDVAQRYHADLLAPR
ncbi:isopenicillin N synthase family oxygenase [Roseomonas sp. NAR14]|uniref:2-oxoglutarate-dependent ethylene/succinate-forming enzyme n=1 Tax=Roseomonas acroporae TaxID=2937791 RepID=A0A9X1Y704_9PROT|nr:isopenicillin N synthase family oxygenase [Roseomonas acroporae]MCK8784285.1 isopenicillin N synthase family oxygenase [Roseomonas acroporae]